MTQSEQSIVATLAQMAELHDRTFAPLRQIMDRLPRPVEYEMADIADLIPQRPAQTININIFISQESDQ